MPRAIDLSLARRLSYSVVGYSCALLLALAAARAFQPPNLFGISTESPWLETDFLLSVASSAVALSVAHWGRPPVVNRGFGSLFAGAAVWLVLTVLLLVIWTHYLALSTLLIAPSHAFACLRLVLLSRSVRSEARWRNL